MESGSKKKNANQNRQREIDVVQFADDLRKLNIFRRIRIQPFYSRSRIMRIWRFDRVVHLCRSIDEINHFFLLFIQLTFGACCILRRTGDRCIN